VPTKTIDIKDVPRAMGKLKDETRKAAIKGLQSAAMRALQKIRTEVITSRQPPPVDRGIYRAAWKVESLAGEGALIYNDELVAILIEYGVRAENVKPGAAMIQALGEWAMRKGLAADEKEARGVAFAIANAGKRRGFFNRGGTPGFGILDETVAKLLPNLIKEEVEREVQRALEGFGT
jgi:hypothetical protein